MDNEAARLGVMEDFEAFLEEESKSTGYTIQQIKAILREKESLNKYDSMDIVDSVYSGEAQIFVSLRMGIKIPLVICRVLLTDEQGKPSLIMVNPDYGIYIKRHSKNEARTYTITGVQRGIITILKSQTNGMAGLIGLLVVDNNRNVIYGAYGTKEIKESLGIAGKN